MGLVGKGEEWLKTILCHVADTYYATCEKKTEKVIIFTRLQKYLPLFQAEVSSHCVMKLFILLEKAILLTVLQSWTVLIIINIFLYYKTELINRTLDMADL